MAANEFKNIGADIDTSPVTVYTCGASLKSAVVHALYISNLAGAEVEATIQVYDSSAAKVWHIGLNIPIPDGSTLILDKPVNLEPSDELRVFATSTNVEAFASILETPDLT